MDVNGSFKSEPAGEYKNTPLFRTVIDGVETHFAKVGKGPVLVLVHGLTNNWYGWGPTIDYLKDDFTLYIPDLPGYGHSGDIEEYSIEILAQFVCSFIRALPERVCAVVGISMGSSITAEVGRIMGEELDAIVEISPLIKKGGKTKSLVGGFTSVSSLMSKTYTTTRFLKWIVGTRIMSHAISKYVNMYEYRPELVNEYGFIGKRLMRPIVYPKMSMSVSAYDLLKTMQNYRYPALMLYGRNDKVTKAVYAHELIAKNRPNITVREIDKAGHWVQVERAEEVAREIKKYMYDLFDKKVSLSEVSA
jgi:pimeloyl-ACP methyl ester carboxylesterase